VKTDLTGVWSADALFAPGSQEDEFLVFRSDGTGWVEWMNFGAHEIEFFQWDYTSGGWVIFTSEKRFARDPHNLKRYLEVEPSFEWDHVRFDISAVETPCHGLIPQLELELVGARAGLYGLTRDDADSRSRPQIPT
jgi:hypothetical protein